MIPHGFYIYLTPESLPLCRPFFERRINADDEVELASYSSLSSALIISSAVMFETQNLFVETITEDWIVSSRTRFQKDAKATLADKKKRQERSDITISNTNVCCIIHHMRAAPRSVQTPPFTTALFRQFSSEHLFFPLQGNTNSSFYSLVWAILFGAFGAFRSMSNTNSAIFFGASWSWAFPAPWAVHTPPSPLAYFLQSSAVHLSHSAPWALQTIWNIWAFPCVFRY